MTYRERRERKADRLRGWAQQRRERDGATVAAISDLFHEDIALLTQPGHIPERARLIKAEDRAFDSLRKAESMAQRAAGIEAQLQGSIYSDDPDAIEQLQSRIADLEAQADRIKRYNKSVRAGSPDTSILSSKQRDDLASLLKYAAFQSKRGEFPGYALSNLNGNLKRNRDRLAKLMGARVSDV